MNSAIIEFICDICSKLFAVVEKSAVWRAFMFVYGAVSAWWRDSVIVGFAKNNKVYGRQSVIYKAAGLWIRLIVIINGAVSHFLSNCIRSSVILCFCRTYLQSFLALNTRVIGVLMLAFGGAFTAVRIMDFPAAAFAVMIAGFLLSLTDINLTDHFGGSVLYGAVSGIAGFPKINKRSYDRSKAGCRAAIAAAAAVGVLSGILSARISIYACVLPAALFVLGIILMYPVAGVFLAAFAGPFVPTMALAGLCVYTGVSLILKSVYDEDFKWRFGGAGACIAVWLVILAVSSVFSVARKNSLMVYAMYFVFAGFFFVALNTLRTKEQIYSLCRVFVIAAVIVALYGIMQYVFGWTTENAWIDETMFEDDVMRVYSTLGNPNVLGEYLLLALPLCAVFFVQYKRDSFYKWFYGASFAVLAVCLVLTQSRGCWLGFFLAVVIFVSFYNGKLWAAALIGAAVLPFIIPQSVLSRFASVGNMNDTSTSYRVFIWMGVFRMLKYHFLGGIGMGEEAFAKIYPYYAYSAIIAPHSHNTFLQIVVESGIASLAVFLSAMAILFRYMYSVYRYCEKKSMEAVCALACGAGLAAFLLQSLFDYTFYNYRVLALFFIYAAICASLYSTVRETAQNDEKDKKNGIIAFMKEADTLNDKSN